MYEHDNILTFESIAELREYGLRPAQANLELHRSINSDAEASRKEWCAWFGVGTYADVQHIFTHGWEQGVKWMMGAMAEIEAPAAATTIKRRKSRGDSGDEYDWQSGAQGMSDIAWTQPTPRKVSAPRTITLFCDLTDNSSHHTHYSDFFWRGAAALHLADQLTAAGYNVRIIAGTRHQFISYGQPTVQFNVILKQPDMPVDLNALAASLCLAAFVRTLVFSAICARESNQLDARISYAKRAHEGRGEFRVWAEDQESAKAAVQRVLSEIQANGRVSI